MCDCFMVLLWMATTLTVMGLVFRIVNEMFSFRLLIDRLATLEPRTGLTVIWLSNAESCKNKADRWNQFDGRWKFISLQ